MTTYVALGDSITVGMGDPAPGGGWRGWAALLAGTLPQPQMHNLATLGALAADVERVQLPAGPGPDPEPSSPPPTRLAEVAWMATKGTAWLVRRSRDLVPALVGLAVREWRDGVEREDVEWEPANLNVLSGSSGNLRLNEGLPLAPLKVRSR